MNHPAVGDHPGSLVCITRLGGAVVAAHNTQGGHSANAVCAVCWDHFQEETWGVVHVLSGVNWLQRVLSLLEISSMSIDECCKY